MFTNFRQAMTWLHTWMGLVLGFVLMVCFFFGSLAVFDREIDRWAIPQTRFEPQPMPSFDRMLLPILQRVEPDEKDYAANMPKLHDASKGPMTPRLELPVDEYWAYTTHRDPVLAMGVGFAVPQAKNPQDHNHIHGDVTIDPRSGAIVPNDALKIGSRWFYPMHYRLNWAWKDVGYWIVGLASFTMLVALVTGVIMHRKIFREFFTFRPKKHTQRSALDLHNLTGVVALPFHFFFAFTGLVIFASYFYFPVSHTLLKPLHHVGDANSYVSIFRAGSDRVALVGEGIHFKASTGEVLREDPPRTVVSEINEFLTGLHLQHFEHWLLRWLYVLGGLLGCVCIATGFVVFVEKRKQQHANAGGQGSRVVDALAVTTVTGMLIAAVGMMVANRGLPAILAGKGDWEKLAFWGIWVLAMLHAFVRSGPVAQARMNPAWREQCWALAVLAVAAVVLNAFTTGDHLVKTVFTDTYWPVAGVDLALLASAGIAAWSAHVLARRELGLATGDDDSPDDETGAAPPIAAEACRG